MKSRLDIERIAWRKLEAARCLLDNHLYDDAYYLAGYATELLLKARICKILGVDDFYMFDRAKKELYKPFKVHNYNELLLLSGMDSYLAMEEESEIFTENWILIRDWNQDARYLNGKNFNQVNRFLISTEKFCKWIEKHL